MSMHVRVKRHKTTVFLNVDPTDTVDMMKEALAEQIQEDASRQQLYRGDVALIGSKTVAECGIESDAVLALVLKQADGSWESVDITAFDSVDASPGTAERE